MACIYLRQQGFQIIERNYTQKCGEIDIVAEKTRVIHFIEVKSVSRESMMDPEENMHVWKQRKMARTIRIYLASHDVLEWQCDLVCIHLDYLSRRARVTFMEDIILEN